MINTTTYKRDLSTGLRDKTGIIFDREDSQGEYGTRVEETSGRLPSRVGKLGVGTQSRLARFILDNKAEEGRKELT